MTVTRELRHTYRDLWHRVVTHPFVVEMGEGMLPIAKFREYFLQDYVFVRDLVTLAAMGQAKAPDLQAAGKLNDFLAGVLNPENDLFVRAFRMLDVTEADSLAARATPVTQAFGDFLVRTGYAGTFTEIITVLYVTEGTYLDWGTRLIAAGKHPEHPLYQEWIDLHGPAVLGSFVEWLGQSLDRMEPSPARPSIHKMFHTALRYEYLFWEASYRQAAHWPDQRP